MYVNISITLTVVTKMRTFTIIAIGLLIYIVGVLFGIFLKNCDKNARKSIDKENEDDKIRQARWGERRRSREWLQKWNLNRKGGSK